MNAIILAAGVGHRFLEITKTKNKAFLSVGKITFIERIVCFLKEADIHDITIVTGHLEASFHELAEKYQLTLRKNPYYAMTNNITSIETAIDKLQDTFLIHADVLLFKNIFKENFRHSTVFTVLKNPKGAPQRHPLLNKERRIQGIEQITGNERETTFLGIYYWKKEDMEIVKAYLREYVNDKKRREYHGEWEDILPDLLDTIYLEARQIDSKYAIDVNHIRDYYEAVKLYGRFWKKD